MNNKLIHAFMFVVGATVGSVVTWKLVKTKYEQIAQEEIESVKKAFSRQERNKFVEDLEAVNNQLKENLAKSNTQSQLRDKPSLSELAKEMSEYVDKLKTESYIEKEEKGGSAMIKKPYVIPPNEFGNEAEHDLVELRYFADGVLTDSWYDEIDDEYAEEIIGLDALKCFGVYEDDSVHVRNERMKIDYEILADERRYADIDLNDPDSVG